MLTTLWHIRGYSWITFCSWLMYFLIHDAGETPELVAKLSASRMIKCQLRPVGYSGRVKLIMVMTTFNESCGCAHTELDGDYTQMASSYNMYHSQNTLNTIKYISMLVCIACIGLRTDGNQRSMQAWLFSDHLCCYIIHKNTKNLSTFERALYKYLKED